MNKKICSKCHKELDTFSFMKDISKKDGLYSSCRDCFRISRGSRKRESVYRIIPPGIEQRKCYNCHDWKVFSEFYSRPVSRRFPKGINNICKICTRADHRTIAYRAIDAARRLKNRMLCLIHYGGNPPSCACCNEKTFQFLAIDHINGGGHTHRKLTGKKVERWLRKNNFPKGFRVLCHNCNSSLGYYGFCPHNKLKQ